MPDNKSFKIGEDTFDIPDAEVESFLKDHPHAEEVKSFTSGKDTFDIPIKEVNDFVKENPEAAVLKKKFLSEPSSETGGQDSPSDVSKPHIVSGDFLKTLASVPIFGRAISEKLPSESSTSELANGNSESTSTKADKFPGLGLAQKENFDEQLISGQAVPGESKSILKEQVRLANIKGDIAKNNFLENSAALEDVKQRASEYQDVLQNPLSPPLQKQFAESKLQEMQPEFEKAFGKAKAFGDVYQNYMNDLNAKVEAVKQYASKNENNLEGTTKELGLSTAQALDNLQGVNNFLSQYLFGHEVEKGSGPLNQIADHLRSSSENNLNNMDNNLLGDVLKGTVGSVPLLVEAAYVPGGFVSAMGANAFGGEYNKTGDLGEATYKGLEGAAEGMAFHGLGELGVKSGNWVNAKTGSEVLDKSTGALVTSLGFGGYDAAKQLASTGTVDWRTVAGSVGTGLAFSIPALAQAGQAKALDDLMVASPEAIKQSVEVDKSVDELRGKSVELLEKVPTIEHPEEKSQAVLTGQALGKVANLKGAVKMAIADPQKITGMIKNLPNVSPEVKQQMIDKVNLVVAQNDPRAIATAEHEKQIKLLEQGIEDNNSNKFLTDSQREAQNKISEEKIKSLKEEVTNIYKPKIEANDQENSKGLQGNLGEGEKPEQKQPNQGTGKEAPRTSGVLQEQKEVRMTDLSPEEKVVEDRFKKDLEDNYEEYKAKYKEKFGNVFNTDNARDFSKDYENSPETMSSATQIPARDFVNKMYEEELNRPAPDGKEDAVLFTAGGSGAGKTRALEGQNYNTQLTVDTNFANFDRAKADVDQALNAGKKVIITYVYRDPVEAFLNGVVPRAKAIRRAVSYEISTSIHDKSLKTIQELADHYKDDPNVEIKYYDNRYEKGNAKEFLLEDVKKLTFDKVEVNKTIKHELDRQYKAGELNESQYRGLTEGKARIENEKRNDLQGVGKSGIGKISEGTERRSAESVKENGNLQGKEKSSVNKNSAGTEGTKVKSIRSGNRTPKSKRPLTERAKEALKVEAKNPYELALQYFIGKKQLHPSAIEKLFGNKGNKSAVGEQRARIGYLHNKGDSIDKIAHNLWESQPEHDQRYDTSDFRDAVEQVITNHNSTKSMADEMLDRNQKQIEEDYYYQDIPEDIPHEFIDEAHDYWNKLTPEEQAHLANDAEANVEKFVEHTPPNETIRAKEIKSMIEKKQSEISASETAVENKAKELDKGLMNDQENLFGERKSQDAGGMFDERADVEQREKTLQPLRDIVEKQKAELKNLQDKLKEEDGKRDDTLFDEESSQTQKAYEDVAGLAPNNNTGRIPVEPIVGGKTKAIKDIILDVSKGTKQRLFFAKPGARRGSLGTYSPGNSAVKIKFNGDLDVTAHEIGHSMDDLFGVLTDLKTQPDIAIENELSKFSPYGSKPPKGHPDPGLYKRAEGFAEFLRALIVNPERTKAEAPELNKLYEQKVSPEYRKALADFSTDVRTFAGSSGKDMTAANIEFKPKESEGIIKEIFGKKEDANNFTITWADRLAANWVNQFSAFNKAFEYAKAVKSVDNVPAAQDPTILARLLLGVDGKYGEILQHGMIDGKNNLLKDAEGNAKNLKWLIEPFDNTDQSTIERDVKDVVSYMVAERTVELADKFGRNNVLTGIGGGIFKDIDVAKKALEEFKSGDPDRLKRMEEGATRYREFSDDILKYMVEKGRLAKEVRDKDGKVVGGYDFIKENNLQYVALQRVMETEPGREVEGVFGKPGNNLGSKTEVIKSVQGSTKQIINPYISLIDTLYKAVKESDRNEVLSSFRDMLVKNRTMYEGEPNRFADIGVQAKTGDKNTTTIFVNGKPEHWIFQEDVHNAIKGLDSEVYKLPAIATALPRVLRWTVTHFPTFAARNIVRDLQDRLIKTEDNSGFKDLYGDKEHWREIARTGGLNSGYYMRDKASYYSLLEEAFDEMANNKKIILADPIKLKSLWKGYSNLLGKSETLNRVAEYRAAFRKGKEQGMDDYNASMYGGYKSRDLMDFALMGHYMKIINQLIPFSNASIQGLRKTVLSAQHNPGGFAARTLVYSVVPSVALWLLNHKDDKTAKEYESLPAYQRDMAFNFKIGPNKWVSIPKPYELSLFGAGIDRGLSHEFADNKNAYDGYAGSVAKSLLPVDEGNFAGPGQGIVEGITNHDFFRDKTLVPPNEDAIDLSLRNTDNASRLGKAIQEVAGIDARKSDHFIKSQFSYFGGAATKVSDLGRTNGGSKFGLPDLGFFRETPAYNSVQVQELMDYAKKWNLGNSHTMKEFGRLTREYFNAPNDKEKEKQAQVLIDYADKSLASWKAQNIAEKKQDKHNNKVRPVKSSAPTQPHIRK